MDQTLPDPESRPSDELRAKVRSKMEVTKFFAGFFTVFVALSSRELAAGVGAEQPPKFRIMAWVAVLAALASLSLTFSAVSAFDSLLMPGEFWQKKTSYTADHVQKQMMRAWNRLYLPSVVALYVAIVAHLYVVSKEFWLVPGGFLLALVIVGWATHVKSEQGVFP